MNATEKLLANQLGALMLENIKLVAALGASQEKVKELAAQIAERAEKETATVANGRAHGRDDIAAGV